MAEIRYAEVVIGGPNKRNNVRPLDEVEIPDNVSDCYVSMFRFPRAFQEHVAETGSVSGSNHIPCHGDYLWFDIDDEHDLDRAIGTGRMLISNMEGIDPEMSRLFEIWFSGKKGFHIGLPSALFGLEPSTDMPRICKTLALRIAGDLQIDARIYEHNRLWRVPNTCNSKSGLFKTRLEYDEFATWTADQIRDKAKVQQGKPYLHTPPTDIRPHPELVVMYNEAKEQADRLRQRLMTRPRVEADPAIISRPCIQNLLQGVGNGERNETGLRLADAFRKSGMSQDTAEQMLHGWNDKNEPPLPDTEIRTVVQSAYSGRYDFGCNDTILKAACSDSCVLKKAPSQAGKEQKAPPACFVKLADGSLAEEVFDPTQGPSCQFAVYREGSEGSVHREHQVDTKEGQVRPYWAPVMEPGNRTLLFPTWPKEYESQQRLIWCIDHHVRKYLSVSEKCHLIIPYYVLLSWVYDRFATIPYLRAIGDLGTGKSRFLDVVGSLCYRPLFTAGASTMAPIFRFLTVCRGTLVYDEADFNKSDESSQMVKLLNIGYQQGRSLLRCERVGSGPYEPVSYTVFGPKILATRHEFEDLALESRCLTEKMDGRYRKGIPENLSDHFWDEALDIRNQLLLWRFRRYRHVDPQRPIPDVAIHARLRQIMQPLACVIEDEKALGEFVKLVQEHHDGMQQQRRNTDAGIILAGIVGLVDDKQPVKRLLYKQVLQRIQSVDDSASDLTPREIGVVNSRDLHLPTGRGSDGSFFVLDCPEGREKLEYLREKFGMNREN